MVPSVQWFHLIWKFSTSSRLLPLQLSAAVFGFFLFFLFFQFCFREGSDDDDDDAAAADVGGVEAAYSESGQVSDAASVEQVT